MFNFFYITCKNNSEAKKILTILLKKKLIACGNVIKDVQSFFWWNDKISNNKECILVGKTIYKNRNKIIKEVKIYHSYSVPCILFFKIADGNKEFLKWIKDSSK